MTKQEREHKAKNIEKKINNQQRHYGFNCQKNGICFVISKIWHLLYPEDTLFIREYHGRMPFNTISMQNRWNTNTKSKLRKNLHKYYLLK